MANLPENNASWPAGVYQIETTDPVMGGPDGISNKPLKDLTNRTVFLKLFADEVANARGDFATLLERLQQYDAFDPESQNMLNAAVMQALSLGGLAHRELTKTLQVRIQQGEVIVKNRGVISGCVVTKSSTAVRNLSIGAGTCFFGSRLVPVVEDDNSAVIPSNDGASEESCYAYLYEDAGVLKFACTDIGESVPDDAIELYRVIIPAGNTAVTDPYADSVSLSDIRRLEPNYPVLLAYAPYEMVNLDFSFLDDNYSIKLDIVEYLGGGFQQGNVYTGDRAANGFKIYLNGTVDSVRVKWTTVKTDI